MITLKNIENCIKKKRSSYTKKKLIDFLQQHNIIAPKKANVLELCTLVKEKVKLLQNKKTKKDLLEQCKSKNIPCSSKLKIKDLQILLKEDKNVSPLQKKTLNELKQIAKKAKMKGYSSKTKKKDLVQFIQQYYDLQNINLETWSNIIVPGDNSCGFHAIAFGMKLFYGKKYPVFGDSEQDNVLFLRKILIEEYEKQIQDFEQKQTEHPPFVIAFLNSTLKTNNYKQLLEEFIENHPDLTLNQLIEIRGLLLRIIKFKQRKHILQMNPSEWLQDMDFGILSNYFKICFAVCEINTTEDMKLWSAHMPNSCIGSGNYLESCLNKKLPILFLINNYDQSFHEDLESLMANVVGIHYDLLLPDPKSIYRYPKPVVNFNSINNYISDITFEELDAPYEPFYKTFEFTMNSTSPSVDFQDMDWSPMTNNTTPSFSTKTASTKQNGQITEPTIFKQKTKTPQKEKPIFCSQQQVFQSKRMDKNELKQMIKNCFL